MPATALGAFRILELGGELTAYGAKLLADLGADVIVVEPPAGDPLRTLGPFVGDEPGLDHGLPWLYLNTSKRGVTLDLSKADGQAVFRQLAATADAILVGEQPAELAALGLTYPALSADHPELVYCSVAPFGRSGPYRDWRGADLVAYAMGGALYVSGEPERPPVRAAGNQAYVIGSLHAVAGVLLALYARPLSGRGQAIDISLHEVIASIMPEMGVPKYLDDGIVMRRFGTTRPGWAPNGLYDAQDGQVALNAIIPHHWDTLAAWINQVTGEPEVLDPMYKGPGSIRDRYVEVVDHFVRDFTGRFPKADLLVEAQRRHLMCTPVNSPADVVNDVHMAERGFFIDVVHPTAGTLRSPGAPLRSTADSWAVRRPAPRLGEHNRELLGDELGLTRADLAALRAAGVI